MKQFKYFGHVLSATRQKMFAPRNSSPVAIYGKEDVAAYEVKLGLRWGYKDIVYKAVYIA